MQAAHKALKRTKTGWVFGKQQNVRFCEGNWKKKAGGTALGLSYVDGAERVEFLGFTLDPHDGGVRHEVKKRSVRMRAEATKFYN